MTCAYCRREREPVVTECPGCGAWETIRVHPAQNVYLSGLGCRQETQQEFMLRQFRAQQQATLGNRAFEGIGLTNVLLGGAFR